MAHDSCPFLTHPYFLILQDYVAKGVKPRHGSTHRACEGSEAFPLSWGEPTECSLPPEQMILLFICTADKIGLSTSSNLPSAFGRSLMNREGAHD